MRPLANIKTLEVGKVVNTNFIKEFVENQSYQKHGNQIIGEAAIWARAGEVVQDANHIDYAPDGSLIELREHYVGSALLCKHNGKWAVTSIRLRG